MDRPALQRLLGDIGAGKVDVVVVYKIDRLTRSLFDFAKIVEAFDARGVSFVSITQQFNTTTSMGRLTLNASYHLPSLSGKWPAIASQERLTIGYLSRLLRLPSLAPDIVTAIINGKNPPQLTAKRLMRLTPQIPSDWAEQRKLLGFQGE